MNIKQKKGQGISVQTIVIAALAIVVLVVVAIMFTQKTTESSDRISEISALDIRQRCLQDHSDDLDAYNQCVKECQENPTISKCRPEQETETS